MKQLICPYLVRESSDVFKKKTQVLDIFYKLYGQKCSYKNKCKTTPSEDINEGAAQKLYI